jgi:hypothetical protein
MAPSPLADAAVRCPVCRLINPMSALRCDCGYNFSAPTAQNFALKHGRGLRQGDVMEVPPLLPAINFLVHLGLAHLTVVHLSPPLALPEPWEWMEVLLVGYLLKVGHSQPSGAEQPRRGSRSNTARFSDPSRN